MHSMKDHEELGVVTPNHVYAVIREGLLIADDLHRRPAPHTTAARLFVCSHIYIGELRYQM